MNRVIALAAVLCVTGLPAQAERSVFERAKFIYAVMDLRVATLRQCGKLDPSNRSKFEAEIQRYRQETKPLFEKIQKVIIAENPGNPASASLSVIEKWSASESQRNIDFQTARREQFMQIAIMQSTLKAERGTGRQRHGMRRLSAFRKQNIPMTLRQSTHGSREWSGPRFANARSTDQSSADFGPEL
jgi:hypothetical protein